MEKSALKAMADAYPQRIPAPYVIWQRFQEPFAGPTAE
jgi:hypothetical protein